MTEVHTEAHIEAPLAEQTRARGSTPAYAPLKTDLPSDWKAPLVMPDGRTYEVLSVDIQKPEAGPVDQSVVVQRCVLEVSGGGRNMTQRFIVNAYPNAFRRHLLNNQRPETLVMWARRWIRQHLSQPQRQGQADDHKRMADGSIIVACW